LTLASLKCLGARAEKVCNNEQRRRRDMTGQETWGGRARRVLLATAGLAALHGLGLLGGLDGITYPVVGLTAVIGGIIGIRRHRPDPAWPWWVLVTALCFFMVGAASRFTLGSLGDLSASRPLLPEVLTVPGYLLVGLSVTALVNLRSRGSEAGFETMLDAFAVSLASFALAWSFLIAPAVADASSPLTVRLMLAVYPALSVFIVAVLARSMMTDRSRSMATRYQLLAMGSLLVGDVLYMLMELGKLHQTALADVPYVLAYGAFAAHALHPSMTDLARPAVRSQTEPSSAGRSRLAVVALGILTPVLVLLGRTSQSTADKVVLSAVLILLALTATWRVARAVRVDARSRQRLAHQASHDRLTGLPNQVLVRDVLGARSPDHQFAVLFVDVDRFKLVNDSYGHSVGDELLVEAGRRLAKAVGDLGIVARIGGDEFLVVANLADSVQRAVDVGERVRTSFLRSFLLSAGEIYTSVSIGIAMSGPGPADAEGLIRDADTAMYVAKARGRDNVVVFDASMRDEASERLALEQDLRQAIVAQQFELWYQPIVRYPDGMITSVEALIRWHHPERGLVMPDNFIRVAEEGGLIVEIGRWVIEEACRALARWRAEIPGADLLHTTVNVSARQLRDPMLATTIVNALARTGLPPSAICLELTESLLVEDPIASARVLDDLHAIGIRLAIDDFGTGYSALAHLKRFTVDVVKIDRSFVSGLDEVDSSDESLIAAIVAMSGALGISTVAEGVETEAQEAKLLELGCDFGQGYRYQRPTPEPDIVGVLAAAAITSGGTLPR
jgi:diguanylate cyclase (GGDEF)-like protein